MVEQSGGQPSGRLEPGVVTVVVPAYNVERYLGSCLLSLREQTIWPHCRVIVVDDGSSDRTGHVAAEWASDAPQLQIVSQPNQGPGPGAARNRGLDLVRSEYVMFCDGDDELTPTATERLRDGLGHSGLDLAIGASEQFPNARRWLWTDYFTPGLTSAVSIEEVPLLVHNAATGNKMFRTDWLRRQGWRFAVGIHHQDTVVTVPAMLAAEQLALIGDVVHRYRKRAEGDSIMDSHYTRIGNYWDHLQVIEELALMLMGLPAERRRLLEAFIARSFQGFAWRAPRMLSPEVVPEFFARSRAVITQLAIQSIVSGTRHAGERAAYVTMLENDRATYENLDHHLDRLLAWRGDLYIDVPTRSEEHRRMLKTAETRAVVGDLAVSAGALEVGLRIRLRGARNLVDGLNGMVLRLVPEHDGPAQARELISTPDTDPAQVVARCSMRTELLDPGRYRLRVGFRTWTGQTARWVRRSHNDGQARVTTLTAVDATSQRRFAISGDHEERAVLEVLDLISTHQR